MNKQLRHVTPRTQHRLGNHLLMFEAQTAGLHIVIFSQGNYKQVKLAFTRAYRSINELGKKWLKTWQN